MATGNGNGNRTSGSTAIWIAIAISVGSFATTIAGAFWSVANPRGDLQGYKIEQADAMKALEARLNVEIDTNRKTIATHLPTDVYGLFRTDIEKRLDTIETEIRSDRPVLIRRVELDGKLAILNERLGNLRDTQRRLDEQFNGSYNIGKALEAMAAHLTENDRKLDTLMSRTPPIPVTPVSPSPLAPMR
jgi:hypothetical protein